PVVIEVSDCHGGDVLVPPGEGVGGDVAVRVGGHVRLGPKGPVPAALQEGDTRVDVGLVVSRVDGAVGVVADGAVGVVAVVAEPEPVDTGNVLVRWIRNLRPL